MDTFVLLFVLTCGQDLSSAICKLNSNASWTKQKLNIFWHVSLTGGDWILLSKEEAMGFWGPGVFLSDGLNCNQPITSRVAYWAGSMDPNECGESSQH